MATHNGKEEVKRKLTEIYNEKGYSDRMTIKQAGQAIDVLKETISVLLEDVGDVVELQTFVKFTKVKTNPRTYYNVNTKSKEVSTPKIKIRAKANLK